MTMPERGAKGQKISRGAFRTSASGTGFAAIRTLRLNASSASELTPLT
jgi:hypothetical protein